MLPVPSGDPQETLIQWVRDWLDLLAAGQLTEACARLDGPAPEDGDWTPERLVALVNDIYRPGTPFHREHPEGPIFTPVATAQGRPLVDVGEFDDGTGY